MTRFSDCRQPLQVFSNYVRCCTHRSLMSFATILLPRSMHLVKALTDSTMRFSVVRSTISSSAANSFSSSSFVALSALKRDELRTRTQRLRHTAILVPKAHNTDQHRTMATQQNPKVGVAGTDPTGMVPVRDRDMQKSDLTTSTQAADRGAQYPSGPADASNSEADIQHLNKIMKNTKTCMLTTHSEHGLHSRPMATAHIDFDMEKGEAIYFVTERDSVKCKEIQANPQVALVFSDDANNNWASVSANATIIEDKEKAKECWSPLFNAWFPKGPETEGVVLVKAVPTCGTYWDGSYASRLQILFSAVKARVTGAPIDMGMTQETKSVNFPPGQQQGVSAH